MNLLHTNPEQLVNLEMVVSNTATLFAWFSWVPQWNLVFHTLAQLSYSAGSPSPKVLDSVLITWSQVEWGSYVS